MDQLTIDLLENIHKSEFNAILILDTIKTTTKSYIFFMIFF